MSGRVFSFPNRRRRIPLCWSLFNVLEIGTCAFTVRILSNPPSLSCASIYPHTPLNIRNDTKRINRSTQDTHIDSIRASFAQHTEQLAYDRDKNCIVYLLLLMSHTQCENVLVETAQPEGPRSKLTRAHTVCSLRGGLFQIPT